MDTKRVALVTGASAGIGAAIALRLARGGWTVGCLSRRGTVPAGAEDDGFANLVALAADVAGEDMPSVIEDFVNGAGRLDLLVNCAGIHSPTPSSDLDPDELRHVLEVNLVAPVRASQLAFPHLRQARGTIVNVGSFYEQLGVPRSLAYVASKAGLAGVTRTLAAEWGRHGVTVFQVSPGYVHTELNAEYLSDPAHRERVEGRIPVGRVAEADEIAEITCALVAGNRGFLTGTTITIDGGEGTSL